MSYPNKDTLEQLLAYVCKGDRNGIEFGLGFWDVIHFWDDLIDDDYVSPEDINRVMTSLLVDLPLNPLFAHPQINATIRLVISNWMAANVFEKGKENLEKAYMMRAFAYNLPISLAMVIGGQEWANEVAPIVWRAYGEKLNEFVEEVQNA